MAKIRIGLGSEFNLKDQKVGLGTNNPQERLDVAGVAKGKDLKVTGISSFTAYEGFLRADQQIAENTTLSFDQGPSASLSGEIIVGTGQTVTVNEIVKDTAGVGVGTNPQWRNLVNTGDAKIATGNRPVWNGNTFVFNKNGGFNVDNYSETFETSITVEWWGTSDYPNTDFRVPVIRTSTSSWNDGFGFYQRNGSVFWWVNTWNAAQTTEIAATSFGMTHWVGTYDGSNLKLYRNGSLVDTGSSFTANITEPSDGLLIGQGGGNASPNNYYWDGNISIVRIYSTALTAAQINAQFKLGPTSLLTVVEPDAAHFNANNPLSYPGKVSTVDTTDATRAGGSEIECLKVYNTFTPPSGGTNERPYAPKPGELYYNYDFKTIEFFDGYGWRQVDNTTRSGRAVFGGGYSVSGTNTGNMEFVNIMSLGNGVNFGDMVLSAKYSQSGCSDGKRGLFVGGQNVSDIEYITIASEGDSIDFGDLTGSNGNHCGSLSSSTRGIRGGGYTAPAGIDVMDYVEIQTLGAALDFGNLLEGNYGLCGFSSPTRGIFAGGRGDDTPLGQTTINVITISSKGDATRFGDISARHSYLAGFSNSVRGVITGGGTPRTDTIQYVTIASEGNAQDFGNLSVAKEGSCSGNSANQVRGICAGGVESAPAGTKLIEYITIASQGNSQDFGDMSSQRGYAGACSDSHGGLGGF